MTSDSVLHGDHRLPDSWWVDLATKDRAPLRTLGTEMINNL